MQNQENLEKVKELMSKAQNVNLGEKVTQAIKIDFTSDYGNHYEGSFVFKRPSMIDYMRMGSLKAQFLGQSGAVDLRLVDETIKMIAQAMATLKVVVVKAPEWLVTKNGQIDIEGIQEPDLLYHIFEQYEEWENAFRRNVSGELQGDSETSESEEVVDTP